MGHALPAWRWRRRPGLGLRFCSPFSSQWSSRSRCRFVSGFPSDTGRAQSFGSSSPSAASARFSPSKSKGSTYGESAHGVRLGRGFGRRACGDGARGRGRRRDGRRTQGRRTGAVLAPAMRWVRIAERAYPRRPAGLQTNRAARVAHRTWDGRCRRHQPPRGRSVGAQIDRRRHSLPKLRLLRDSPSARGARLQQDPPGAGDHLHISLDDR